MADEGIENNNDDDHIWTEEKKAYFNRRLEETRLEKRRELSAQEDADLWDEIHNMSNAAIKEKFKPS